MKRYAVYYAPRDGAFAARAAAWLGYDAVGARSVPHPDVQGLPAALSDLTKAPRKYGFHGTIRAPFRAADGLGIEAIAAAVAALARRLPPVICEGLQLENIDGYLALVPQGCEAALLDLGAQVVEGTNALRAPLTDDEIARRVPARLSARQRDLLDIWGYPYVMEEFQFHLTLTSALPRDQAAAIAPIAAAHFAPTLPRPFVIEDLCLFGEDARGFFHLLHRYALAG